MIEPRLLGSLAALKSGICVPLHAGFEMYGAGFDMASVEGSYGQRGSLGLLNMRERAEMVDGMLTIRSVPGFGTTVTVRVPLSDATTSAGQTGEARGG